MTMTEARYPAAKMRASDADRDAVVATLSEAYQAGRLTTEELDDRTGRALAARTLGELAPVTADLPRPAPGGPRPDEHPTGPVGRPAAVVLAVLAVALIVGGLAVLGAFGVTGRGHHGAEFWWVIPVAVLAARRLARGDRRRDRS